MPLLEVLLNEIVHPAQIGVLPLTDPEAFLHRRCHPFLARSAPVEQGPSIDRHLAGFSNAFARK